jgi:hypothetical protein
MAVHVHLHGHAAAAAAAGAQTCAAASIHCMPHCSTICNARAGLKNARFAPCDITNKESIKVRGVQVTQPNAA